MTDHSEEIEDAALVHLLLHQMVEERQDNFTASYCCPAATTPATQASSALKDVFDTLLLHLESMSTLRNGSHINHATPSKRCEAEDFTTFVSDFSRTLSLSLPVNVNPLYPAVDPIALLPRLRVAESEEPLVLQKEDIYLSGTSWPMPGALPPQWNRYLSWVTPSLPPANNDKVAPIQGMQATASVDSSTAKPYTAPQNGQENPAESAFTTAIDILKKRKAMGNPEAVMAVRELDSSNRSKAQKEGNQDYHVKLSEGRNGDKSSSVLLDITRRTVHAKQSSSLDAKKGELQEDMLAYKEVLGGEIREDILTWVLSMRLSPSDRTEEDSIAGLKRVKKLMTDKLINPILRPELHVGLHQAPKGILLFGPPGTGKTMLAKWMATASGATFFEVTPSAIISKYHGETETLIRTLYKVAEIDYPSIIFIDEIDSLLGKRRDKEDDSTIRMKNQLLQMMDGVSSDATKMVVLVGATNRPDMLDEAALRRLSKRVLIPLPDLEARKQQVRKLLAVNSSGDCQLTEEELQDIAMKINGWNGSDIKSLCAKAAEYSYDETIEKYGGIVNVPNRDAFRQILYADFEKALLEVHPSSLLSTLDFEQWARQYGTL